MASTPRPPSDSAAPPGTWRAARHAARRLLAPVERFLAVEASAGLLLLGATIVALAWANSPWPAALRVLLLALDGDGQVTVPRPLGLVKCHVPASRSVAGEAYQVP